VSSHAPARCGRSEVREPSVDDGLLERRAMIDAVERKALFVRHVRRRVGIVRCVFPGGAHGVVVEAVIGASLVVHHADSNPRQTEQIGLDRGRSRSDRVHRALTAGSWSRSTQPSSDERRIVRR